ncbi:hypothetical protein AUEXF2481DRAFT_449374 [Aureobasidium subglaciale EXF-2481]|uniref:Secreted protein n=1 Tax=Aureobasidium subglaciale (strain EXF-2481) TaxID=1043005 RepID=A0A074Y7G2_AURSE|nr:uncharacterized protein AUEXF2481DRAFT_449374 [Aureobasidium subglaciale EXF-2481]KEQ91929.1 hypothetical protein AUEXF2481DRAFT_449374 [Aureobasidium subglaciale EXF-2481]
MRLWVLQLDWTIMACVPVPHHCHSGYCTVSPEACMNDWTLMHREPNRLRRQSTKVTSLPPHGDGHFPRQPRDRVKVTAYAGQDCDFPHHRSPSRFCLLSVDTIDSI